MTEFKGIENEVIEMYNNRYSAPQIAKHYDVSSHAVYGLLERNNISRRPASKGSQKYSIREDFFDNIVSEEQAYLLGYLYADGYNDERRRTIRLNLNARDKSMLVRMKSVLGYDGPLHRITIKGRKQEYWRLSITNGRLSRELSRKGCGQAKTFKLKYPDFLLPPMERHFIRGYFDGDGCVTSLSSGRKAYFYIIGTEDLCVGVQNVIFRSIGFMGSVSKRKSLRDNLRVLVTANPRHMFSFMQWIYDDAHIYLERKKEKFTRIKEYWESKHRINQTPTAPPVSIDLSAA